jgi:hypothetical protein
VDLPTIVSHLSAYVDVLLEPEVCAFSLLDATETRIGCASDEPKIRYTTYVTGFGLLNNKRV